MLARALYKQAYFILLDEFSAALDEKLKLDIIDILIKTKQGMLNIAHQPEVIKALSLGGVVELNK